MESRTHSWESEIDRLASKPCRFNLVERLAPILVFAFSLGYLCTFLRYTSLEPDEGILLQGAQRILDGQVLYRDFFSFYTPGSLYLVAALFKTFGDSFLVARISLAITGAGCSALTYLLARRVCSRGYALLAAGLTTGAGVAYRFLVLHNWYSTLLACLALYSVVRLLESRKPVWAFAVGSFCSLTTMFEQSKGAGLCLGLIFGLLALRSLGRKCFFQKPQLTLLAAGLCWPLVLVFAYFGAQHGVNIMVEDWLWPLRHYTNANQVFYGYQNWSDSARDSIFYSGPLWARVVKILAVSPGVFVPLLPLIAVGAFIYWVLAARRVSALHDNRDYYIVVSGVLSGLLVSILIVRADIIHFMYLAPLWYVPLVWVLNSRQFRVRVLLALRPYLVLLIVAGFGLMSLVILTTANGAQTRIVTRRGVIVSGAPDEVIDYLQNHAAAGEQILVYPYLPLYYYLSATRSAAPLDYFQPGMNTPEQGREIISSLRSQNVNTVLFEASFVEKIATSWPGTPLRSIANDPIGDYILRNYRSCRILKSASASRFQVMVPRSQKCQ
jgi:4-amino-4-deoxy-L-arabinose transferase and related glycosyltransferases of PMT family